MSDVPQRWHDMAMRSWADSYKSGDSEGSFADQVVDWAISPVLADLRRQVEAITYTSDGAYWAFKTVLDLIDTGGSDD